MARKLSSQGESSSLITIIVSTLIALLFSNWILGSISQISLFEVEAQPVNTTSLQGKSDDLRTDAQNMAKKLREVTGEKIPNQYIVILKGNNLLSPAMVRSFS